MLGRTTVALISAVWLSALFAGAALADSHTVTTVPSTGVGPSAGAYPNGLMLALVGLAAVLVLAAVRQGRRI